MNVSEINGVINSKISIGLLVKLSFDDKSTVPQFETACGDHLYIYLPRLKPLKNKDQARVNNGEVSYTKEQITMVLDSLCFADSTKEELLETLGKSVDPEFTRYIELKNKFEG